MQPSRPPSGLQAVRHGITMCKQLTSPGKPFVSLNGKAVPASQFSHLSSYHPADRDLSSAHKADTLAWSSYIEAQVTDLIVSTPPTPVSDHSITRSTPCRQTTRTWPVRRSPRSRSRSTTTSRSACAASTARASRPSGSGASRACTMATRSRRTASASRKALSSRLVAPRRSASGRAGMRGGRRRSVRASLARRR